MNRRSVAIALTLISLLAFGARVGTDVHFHAWTSPGAMEHRSVAAALASGHGFTFGDWNYYGPTSVQSPPFPFLLAGLFHAYGAVRPDASLIEPAAERAYFAVLMINAVAGAALVWLTYLMTRTLGGTALAGVVAAGLVAVWPTQVYAARFVQAIALITCLLTAMVILYYRSVRTGRLAPWVGFSVAASLATLTEPVFLPALLFSGAMVLFHPKLAQPVRLRNAAVLAFACLAIIGPWTVRNYIVHGKVVPIKGSFWVNMWKGNNDYATGTDRLKMTPAQAARAKKENAIDDDNVVDGPHQYDMLTLSQKGRLNNQPEAVREGVFKEFATTWIVHHKRQYLHLCGVRLFKTLSVDWDNPHTYSPVYLAGRAVLWVLTLSGLVVAWRQRWAWVFPTVVLAAALASYTLTVTAARFAVPFEPLQLALGGAAIAAVIERRRQASGRGTTVALASVEPDRRAATPDDRLPHGTGLPAAH